MRYFTVFADAKALRPLSFLADIASYAFPFMSSYTMFASSGHPQEPFRVTFSDFPTSLNYGNLV